MQLRDLVVIKKNGRREDFDRDKLERSIRVAMQKRPVEQDRIEQMITGIVRRLESLGDIETPSDAIGKIVMETLARVDTVGYVRFASVYKNFQAANADLELIVPTHFVISLLTLAIALELTKAPICHAFNSTEI